MALERAAPRVGARSRATTGWVEEVGSVYCELPAAVLLVDPVVPADPGEAERLWRALDRDVERLGDRSACSRRCTGTGAGPMR